MKLLEWLFAKWQASRLMCHYCGDSPVYGPGMFCSGQCEEWGMLEDLAHP